jgi:hypothetical protein
MRAPVVDQERCWMGKAKKMKVTPVLETGITLGFKPGEAPVPKTCHLMLRWAVEKCPVCGSTLMIYYSPTIKHELGEDAVSSEEDHKIIISCVNCNWLASPGLWNWDDEMLKRIQKQMEQLQKLGEVKSRKNIGEV